MNLRRSTSFRSLLPSRVRDGVASSLAWVRRLLTAHGSASLGATAGSPQTARQEIEAQLRALIASPPSELVIPTGFKRWLATDMPELSDERFTIVAGALSNIQHFLRVKLPPLTQGGDRAALAVEWYGASRDLHAMMAAATVIMPEQVQQGGDDD